MAKLIKVARWFSKEDVCYSHKMSIEHINIDMIYKIYQFKKEKQHYYSSDSDYIKFNFHNFDKKYSTTETPTVIVTKEKDTFYHPLTVEELIKNKEISITSRFDIIDL